MTATEDATYYVVLELSRWERTSFVLTAWDRIKVLFTGRVTMEDTHPSIGWIPVFDDYCEAEAYRDGAGTDAQIMPMSRRLEMGDERFTQT